MEKNYVFLVIIALLGGMLGGYGSVYFSMKKEVTQEDLIREFYLVENAVHVSPHSLRKSMDKEDTSFIVVDLRSEEEYSEAHIKGAVNIPAYKNRDESDYGAKDRIVGAFAALPDDKDIIVYCYSTPCMTGRKIGKMLIENGIYVKHLGIGWNEWRYSWTTWNHEHEWNKTNVEDYIWQRSMSPLYNTSETGCQVDGELGC